MIPFRRPISSTIFGLDEKIPILSPERNEVVQKVPDYSGI
jgi:hypothetical protein